jgi:hypothetical protein
MLFGWFKKKKKSEDALPNRDHKPVQPPKSEAVPVVPESVATPAPTPVPSPNPVEPEVEEDVVEEVVEPVLDLDSLTVKELREMAKERNLTGYSSLKKAELIDLLK